MKLDEPTARKIVSGFQWSVSGVIVVVVMIMLTGIEVWGWLAAVVSLYVSIVGPIALVAGMVLAWRLPDWRKWLIVPIEIFVLFTGVGLIHVQVNKAKESEVKARYEAFISSPEYVTAKDAYDAAKAKQGAWVDRIGKLPGDFTTATKQVKENTTSAGNDFEKAKDEFLAIAAKAPKQAELVTAASSFRIFGENNSTWLEGLVLFILALGNEAIALAISWRGKPEPIPKPVQTEEPKEPPKKEAWRPILGEQQEPKKTAEDYMEAAKAGRTDGRVWGREKVATMLGISERQIRHLYAECVEKGFIIPSSAPKSAPSEEIPLANAQE